MRNFRVGTSSADGSSTQDKMEQAEELHKIREEAKEPSKGEITKEEREALGKQFDYDGLRLTSEQRRALGHSRSLLFLSIPKAIIGTR